MYLRFKDLSGLGVTNLLPGGDIPQGGGLETKTLLVAPMTMPSYSPPTPTYGGTAAGVQGPSIPVPPVASLPVSGTFYQAKSSPCAGRYDDPQENENKRAKALQECSQRYARIRSITSTMISAANSCQLGPTSSDIAQNARNTLIENANKGKDLSEQARVRFNAALNENCAGPVEDQAVFIQNYLTEAEALLANSELNYGNCGNKKDAKKGGSLVSANSPGSTNYSQQGDAGYSDYGYGDILSTPMNFDGGFGFDSWSGSPGGYISDPGFDQFTDLEPGGGDGSSLDYTSGGDQAPGDTFGAPEVEIPQDQGIDLNLPTGNEGGMIQGKKFPWWLLLVGGAVLAMSNDGKGKKKGKR